MFQGCSWVKVLQVRKKSAQAFNLNLADA